MEKKLYIYSKPTPKLVDLIWHFDEQEEVTLKCDVVELYSKMCFYYYNHDNSYYSKQSFVFQDANGNFLIIDERENHILIKQKGGKVLLKIEPSDDSWDSLHYQVFKILHHLEDNMRLNYCLEEVISSKHFDKNNKYNPYLKIAVSKYNKSEEYLLRDDPICAINIGGGWAHIHVKTVDDKCIFLFPGYITDVPWDLMTLFIEYLSNDKAEYSISFEEEPGNPELLIHDNKLFVKTDYTCYDDTEEIEVAGTKLEQAKAIYKSLGATLKEWCKEFHFYDKNDKEKSDKIFEEFKQYYEKLGELIKNYKV